MILPSLSLVSRSCQHDVARVTINCISSLHARSIAATFVSRMSSLIFRSIFLSARLCCIPTNRMSCSSLPRSYHANAKAKLNHCSPKTLSLVTTIPCRWDEIITTATVLLRL